MKYTIVFFIIFLTIFISLYLLQYLIPKKRELLGLNRGLKFIVRKYDLNMDKGRVKKLTKLLVLTNTIILTIPIFLFIYNEMNYYFVLLLSFILFTFLIFTFYNAIGFILKKRGW